MELLHQLGIEPGALFINIVGFLVLLWFMKRFLFGPISQFMAQRANEIEKQIAEAREMHEAAEAERAKLRTELEAGREQARDEIAQMTHEAKQAIEALHREGRKQRQEIVEQGRAEVERSKDTAVAELKQTVSDIALEIASRAIRESLDAERQAALVDSFIADVRHATEQARPQ